MSAASDTTNRRKNRTLYADRIVQLTTLQNGIKNHLILEGGIHTGRGAMTFVPNFNGALEGVLETTEAEREAYVNSVPTQTPNPPLQVTAVAGDAQAAVSFSASPLPTTAPTLSYTVTSSPGSISASGSKSPIVVTGLTNGVTYTFQVVARNVNGTSAPSAPSNAVTPVSPATPPGAPTNLCAVPGINSTLLYFTAPTDDGGATITDYEYSTNDGSSWSSSGSTSSPITISGLVLGTVYTVRLRAVNSAGAGDSSSSVSVAGLSSFDPTNIAGMNVWLDGQVLANTVISGGKVASWTDRSGSANHFTASAGGTITYDLPSGINGRPAMNFTTSAPTQSTYLGKDNVNLAPTNKLSVFLVVRQTGNGVPGNSELFFTRNNFQYLDLFNRTNGDGLLCVNIGSGTQNSTGTDILTTPPINALISFVADTTASMFVNGATTSVSGATRGGLSLNDATLDWAISGGAFLGNVGELMCFAAPLNSVQRQAVEGYLAWKWGTQASLPVGHPYTASPPTLTLPNPPIGLMGTAGNTEVSIAFTPGANGGTAITNYQYSVDGGATFTAFSPAQTSSPVLITGLTNGTTYSISLKTVTAFGASDASATVSVTPAPVVSGSPSVLILGDASVSSVVASGIQSAKTNLGYSGTVTITTKNVVGADSGYTGDDLASYDVVLLYTNGGATPSSTLGANLDNYVGNGGKFIMGVFSWGNVSSFPGLTYAISSTYQYKGTNSFVGSPVTNLVAHPILSGIDASIVISNFYTSGISLNSGATSIAQFNDGTSFLAVSEPGVAKLVGINVFPALGSWESSDGSKNVFRYLVNAIYWCIGSLT